MKNSEMTINEKTKISLYALGAVLSAAITAAIWIATIDAKASAAERENNTTRTQLERMIDKLESIDSRLSHIEGKLNK